MRMHSLTQKEMDLSQSRSNQRALNSLMIEPSQWEIARRITQDPYVGETECLRGLFLPDRKVGKIIWWPARYMAHWHGVLLLKVPRDERRLELEINLYEDRLGIIPDEEKDGIEREFYNQPTIRSHHDGWLTAGKSYITIVDKKIKLRPIKPKDPTGI